MNRNIQKQEREIDFQFCLFPFLDKRDILNKEEHE